MNTLGFAGEIPLPFTSESSNELSLISAPDISDSLFFLASL
jgi:hypothetical protein